jgi:hypothetical protein
MDTQAFSVAHAHTTRIMPLLKHAAAGHLRQPYLSVGYGEHYAGHIFSWDNHHMALRFAAAGEPEQMRYFVDNLLSFQAASGYVPALCSATDGAVGMISDFHAQPFLAQNADPDGATGYGWKIRGQTRMALTEV